MGAALEPVLAAVLPVFGTALAGYMISHFMMNATSAENTPRALNASFANTGYLGIPLVTVAYGERVALPAALLKLVVHTAVSVVTVSRVMAVSH